MAPGSVQDCHKNNGTDGAGQKGTEQGAQEQVPGKPGAKPEKDEGISRADTATGQKCHSQKKGTRDKSHKVWNMDFPRNKGDKHAAQSCQKHRNGMNLPDSKIRYGGVKQKDQCGCLPQKKMVHEVSSIFPGNVYPQRLHGRKPAACDSRIIRMVLFMPEQSGLL